tara:strand:- start:860 stop:979 length:120 start_codon:yes stop_codon:yes gene_type:complete
MKYRNKSCKVKVEATVNSCMEKGMKALKDFEELPITNGF